VEDEGVLAPVGVVDPVGVLAFVGVTASVGVAASVGVVAPEVGGQVAVKLLVSGDLEGSEIKVLWFDTGRKSS